MSVTKWSQDVDFVEIQYEFQEKEIINCSFDEEMIYINVGKKRLMYFFFRRLFLKDHIIILHVIFYYYISKRRY